jgi:segregation and condensation protein B
MQSMKIETPQFLTLERTEQRNILEALIFAASKEENLSAENIINIVTEQKTNNEDNENDEQVSQILTINDIEQLIGEINEELEKTERPYRIVHYANCYQFATLPEYGEVVERMLSAKTKKRFTTAQLETLSIIAYKQPVTKQEIDRIRGVMSSSEIVNTLIEKGLVEISGRKDVLGKPLLYSTTNDFLRTFGLQQLADLPKLRELDEIAEEKLKEEELQQTDLVIDVSEEDIDKLRHYDIVEIVDDGNE